MKGAETPVNPTDFHRDFEKRTSDFDEIIDLKRYGSGKLRTVRKKNRTLFKNLWQQFRL